MLLADRAFDVNSYDLDDGNLTIRSGNLLAFQPSLSLKQSIVPGFLTLIGTGKFVAASNGPVVFMEPPDPGGPAGARRLGRLPLPVPPLRPRVHDGRDGRSTCTDGPRRRLRRGAPVRVRRAPGTVLLQSTEILMAEQATGAVPHEPGVPGGGRRGWSRRARSAIRRTAPSRTAGGPPASLRAVSGSLRSVTSNACAPSHHPH